MKHLMIICSLFALCNMPLTASNNVAPTQQPQTMGEMVEQYWHEVNEVLDQIDHAAKCGCAEYDIDRAYDLCVQLLDTLQMVSEDIEAERETGRQTGAHRFQLAGQFGTQAHQLETETGLDLPSYDQ